jgi:hypothetical protein
MTFPADILQSTGQFLWQHTKPSNEIHRKFEGKLQILYPTGCQRDIFPCGYKQTFFQNGDIRQDFPTQKTVYFFARNQVTQTECHATNTKFLLFKKTGQLEKHWQDGRKEILYPSGQLVAVP